MAEEAPFQADPDVVTKPAMIADVVLITAGICKILSMQNQINGALYNDDRAFARDMIVKVGKELDVLIKQIGGLATAEGIRFDER